MTDEEKKKINENSLYERFRTTQPLTELYDKITTRPAFSYDVGTDPLYQQYKDRYTQLGKQSMRDTMGQAAALTGGYGNTYAQSVGQQTYDRYMQGLTDKIPELYSAAYSRWQDEGSKLAQQYSMARDLEGTAYNRQQDAYSRLYSMISSTGYQPTDEELTAAGMPREVANRLRTIAVMNNERLSMIDSSGNLIPQPVVETPSYGGGTNKGNQEYYKATLDEANKLLQGSQNSSADKAAMVKAINADNVLTSTQKKNIIDAIYNRNVSGSGGKVSGGFSR